MNEETANTESLSDNLSMLVNDAGKYVEKRVELAKLKAINQSTEIASSVVALIIVAVLAFIGLFILSLGIAFLIGSWLNAPHHGFFIVAGFYIVLCLILYFARKKVLKTPFYNAIVNKLVK